MWTARVRRVTASTVILMVLILLGGSMYRTSVARRSWRPRITILLALDTLRADRLGCYGYSRPTSPFIDQIAREGVLFENACSQANNTRMSFLSMLTGRYMPDTAQNLRVPPGTATLASCLSSYGFRTAAFVGGGQLNHVFGFDRGFDTYDDRSPFGSVFYSVPKAVEWLKTAGEGRSFLFVHGYDSHAPYYKPLGFESLYDAGYSGPADILSRAGAAVTMVEDDMFYLDPLIEALKTRGQLPTLSEMKATQTHGIKLTDADRRHLSSTYDGAISYADVLVGLLMRSIHDLHLEEETLLVFMGDHGEEMFESGHVGHGIELTQAELHVPLVFWAPGGLPAGVRMPDVVSLVDIMPTILDFAGVPGDDLAGRSLRPLLVRGERRGLPQMAVSFVSPHAAVYDGRSRLVVQTGRDGVLVGTDPKIEGPGLFDTRLDPVQRHDLSADPAHAPVVAALREHLQAEMQRPRL